MNTVIYGPAVEKDKEILSELIVAVFHHIPYSPDGVLKDYMTWCYDAVFNKTGVICKAKQKELDYLLEQEGDKLRTCIYERYQRGYENAVVTGGKRTIMRDITMLKKKSKPKKKSHS